MKKALVCIMIAAMTVTTANCGIVLQTASTVAAAEERIYSSTEEVTLEKMMENSKVSDLIEECGTFAAYSGYSGSGDEMLDGIKSTEVYGKADGYYAFSESLSYPDGYESKVFFSNDPDDKKYYIASTLGNEVADLEGGEEELFESSVLPYDETYSLKSVEEKDGMYVATVESTVDGAVVSTEEVTIDPVTGRIMKTVCNYANNKTGNDTTCTREFSYEGQELDLEAKTANEGAAKEEKPEDADSGQVIFSTTDIDGNPVSSEDFRESTVHMLNYWEPWCGPCVGELAELQKLYENYSDKGLIILGVYSTFDQDEDAKAILEAKGVNYPILRCNEELAKFQKDYVPHTIFTDAEGNILGEVAGAQNYEQWEKEVQNYLN